ncbi:unnamed protein product [Durusdinium trenchii]|uniref:1,4-alpha-glucan branching enzyme n=1 Tax=Durusdinium trenchii TaxID=1381693 RepID=A0ABP0L7R0_9DINO
MSLKIFEIDRSLESCQGGESRACRNGVNQLANDLPGQIWDRVNGPELSGVQGPKGAKWQKQESDGYKWWLSELEKTEGGIEAFAEGYKIFGFNRDEEKGGYVYREWLPNAKQVFLIGGFNDWQNSTPLTNEGFGRWSLFIKDKADGSPGIPHQTQLKVRVEANDGSWHDRVPAWSKLAWQDHTTNLFNGVFWEPPEEDRYVFQNPRPPRPANLKIYEAHVGMGSVEPKVATYTEFAETVLPRIKRMGYNAVQLMAIAEHAHYGCFGYHVTSFYAPASRSGTPEELKYLIDTAHGLGIQVLMDLVHAHASSNTLDGIAQMDGTDHCYTHGGLKGHHSDWDSKIFNYLKYEVLRFLLSNVKWWLEEYQFDGFRFDGVTSMLCDYDGRSQHAYLPDNEEGKKLLAMFQLAFRRRVLFSLSPSLTTQRLHPTFAIHLKTSMTGYPDEQYFNSAMEELRNAGISLEAATPVAIGLNASLASRIRQKCGFVLSQIESKLLMASLIILWITPQGRATFFPCFSILIVLGLPPKPGVAWSAVLFFTYFGTTTPRADDEEQQAEFSFVMMSIILISWLFALLKVLLTPRCSCFNRIQRKTRAAIQVPHVKTLLTILVLLLASGYETRAGRIALALCSIHLLLICICIPCPSFRSSISSFGEPLENEMEEVLRQVGANPEHGLNSCNVFVDASQRVFDEMKEEHWALYASTPSLQGRADMKAILKDFLRSVKRPLRCRASGVIHEMLENEKRWASEGYVVFYHLYALSSVLYELQTALANELLDYPLAGPPVMRLSRRAFGDIRSLSEVLSIRDHNISDHAHEYRALAVSAFSSCFASGGYTRSMQRYMMQGFPSGTSNYVKKLIDDLLSAVGIDQPDVIPTLRSRILAAGKAQGLEALGQVLQIFLHDSVVDAFAYGSQPLGALAPRGLPVSAWLRQQCPIEGQVRLVPHPDLFLAGATPRGPLVRIFDHCPSRALQKVALRRELQSLLRPYLNIERARQLLGFESTSDVQATLTHIDLLGLTNILTMMIAAFAGFVDFSPSRSVEWYQLREYEGHIYLMLANDLIHRVVPSAVTVGEDVSGMPTLCLPVEWGGFGFDYRLAMAIPDMFIKYLKESTDDGWGMGHLVHTLTNRRYMEKVIAYAESHDQAIVGDKTLAFWLMDAEMYTGMSCFTSPFPSMCVDRGLALHKMIRLIVLSLGGEGYLNFMGNEFGHPEWIDFPRPENGWSHHHCRRRWDLPEDDLLRYKFFQNFEELMQACENRFQFVNATHQYVSKKDENDKVIIFERGDLVFAFNFHPCNSYEGYQIGTHCEESMRCILDTDEGRFGGHMRLDYGHGNPFSSMGGIDRRPHSVKLYMPARTAQVLCRESLLQGGVKIHVEESFLSQYEIKSADGLKLSLLATKDGVEEMIDFPFVDGCVHLADNWDATFDIVTGEDMILPCKCSKDTKFRVFFPGEYTVAHLGYLRNGQPAEDADKPPKPVAKVATKGYAKPKAQTAPISAAPSPAPAVAAAPAPAVDASPVGSPVAAPAPGTVEVKEEAKPEEAGVDVRDMTRCYSGLHFMDSEALDAALRETQGEQVSDLEQTKMRMANFQENLAACGGDLAQISESYRTFGLQKSGGMWTYCEWMPFAKQVFLVGDFNGWDTAATPLAQESPDLPDVWSATLPSTTKLTVGSKYKLYVVPEEGDAYYAMPAWATRFVGPNEMKLLDAVVHVVDGSGPGRLEVTNEMQQGGIRIYECHPGLVSKASTTSPLVETLDLLPRIARNGYNALQLVGLLECKEPATLGSQPVSLFALSQHLGTTEELRNLVLQAHRLGLQVYMDLPHNGAASAEDGLAGQFFLWGEQGFHPITGARMYNYTEHEVTRYLLASIAFWMNQFGIDGFRFIDIASMIYLDCGRWVPEPSELEEYLENDENTEKAGIQYLMQVNALIHQLEPNAKTIAEDRTMYPHLCEAVEDGGLGFDLRQASNAPDLFRELVLGGRDEEWSMKKIVDYMSEVKQYRPTDKILGSFESAEHCILGRRPLKIAMLSWETLHTIAAGGVAPHVTELAGALHKIGHTVHIFTRSTQSRTWENEILGVIYHEVNFGTDSDFVREIENMCSSFVGHYLHVEGRVGGFDVIHGHDWLVGPAVIQLASMNKRVVFTMHSTETGRCGNVQYGGQSARIRSIEGHACHAAERVIAVSGVLKEEVCSHYQVDGRKVEVIYNGIHADAIAKMEWEDEWTGNTKRDKGFDVMDPMFLFVGRLAVQKGPDLLLEAVPMILQARGNAKFVIVGDGHMKAHLEARAHQLGVGHAVHFAGSVKSGTTHLKALFKSCDAVIVPSRNEPFGIVVLEAWAASKPVIATTCGGPRDFVRPDREGYLVDPNPGSIAWGCCKICENFEHARWMGGVAKEKALNEFNWSFIARKTEQIYYEQMNLHGTPKFRYTGLGIGSPFAAQVLGQHRNNMGVMENNHLVIRGLQLLKMSKLVSAAMGLDASMTWMGSEFGMVDPLDLPRPGNGHSKDKAYVPYSQAENTGLKYKHLDVFDVFLNRIGASLQWLQSPTHHVALADEEKKILCFVRSGCIFAINFHPCEGQTDFRIDLPKDVQIAREVVVALDTEDPRFGGENEKPLLKPTQKFNTGLFKLNLPPRTGLVLAPLDRTEKALSDKLLKCETADALLGA